MRDHRRNFGIARRFVDPGQFIFLDESGAQTGMTRRYGRSPGGTRCVDKTPHGHWETMTMISAIQDTGVVEEATMVFEGPIDGPTFRGYVENCLVPALTPGQIVVMDNLSAHKVEGVRQAIEAAGCDLLVLAGIQPGPEPH